MESDKNILLPKDFEETELYMGPSFENGNEILRYCKSCLNKSQCDDTKYLKMAMGDNFPFWSKKFIAVKVPTSYRFFERNITSVFCKNYNSPQLKILGMPEGYSDGVVKLIEQAEKAKNRYIELNGNALKDEIFQWVYED